MKVAFVAVCTLSHLAFARVLRESLSLHHPEASFQLWLTDGREGDGDVDGARVVASLELPEWRRFAFQYSALELCCAVKPHILLEALSNGQHDAAVYLDCDTVVYSSMSELHDALLSCSVVLTPHLTAPTGSPMRERDVYKHGVFNGGLVGVRGTATGLAFLDWWKGCTHRHCVEDVVHHWYLDQAWLALAPGLFPDVGILRDAAYNVAYWNLEGRGPLSRAPGGDWSLGGQPLRLFHFSGFDPSQPNQLTRWVSDSQWPEATAALAEDYRARLEAHGWGTGPAFPYGFASMTDGTAIEPGWRRLVREEDPALLGLADPFDANQCPHPAEQFRARVRPPPAIHRSENIPHERAEEPQEGLC